MKHLLTCCLLLWAILGPVASEAGEPIRLRVLSYNIHHAQGVDNKLDLERIAQVISSVKPDLVALQEVDQKVKRSQAVDQPSELARLAGMQVVFGANIDLQGGHYGNAVLSRFPIVKHKNHLLPNIEESEQRGVIETEISLPGAVRPLMLLATHLDYRADERERLASIKMINEIVRKQPQQPTILAGDLNAPPESSTLRQLGHEWTSVNDKPLATVPVGEPKKQIDFILYRPRDRWKVIEANILDESVASDHRAIFALLELLPIEER